ncbi:MAG: cardiolipin synthase [Planctomycetes bacterium]|nr:cardiolipin synthase [Planctomycetota bacterium]
MTDYLVFAAALLIDVLAIVTLLLAERRRPTATLAWLFAIIFLPFVGLFFFILIGRTRAVRIAGRSATVAQLLETFEERHGVHAKAGEPRAQAIEPRTQSLLALGRRLTGLPACDGNRAEILLNAAATYRSIISAIEAATDHIHVQFYIIQPDETGRALRDRLARRAREGVKVRVVTDAIGSVDLPANFWNPVVEAGGEVATFRPVWRLLRRFRRRDRVDFRDHRKIVIADGKVGFTGGINVGREYLGLDPAHGRWRDTHIRIAGPAVLMLQVAFASSWMRATDDLLDDARYFPDPETEPDSPAIVQVVDSGPDLAWSPISHFFSQAISHARERVWITSPYFIPSTAVEEALIGAALRGIDVRLLLPARSDSLLVTLASRTYYSMLLEAGVRIFHYERGFLHAKTMVVDDWVGTVGSANMDMRSFHLNFELNAFVYGARFVDQLAGQMLDDLRHAAEVRQKEHERRNFLLRLACAGARLASPLL